MAFNLLAAGPDVELSYIDSGEPTPATSYTTVIAIHGMCYTNMIFQKLLPVAQNRGSRFVALNRRHYPGSTPFSADEFSLVMTGGESVKKEDELQARGVEIATFIDNFIVKNNLPPISSDGKSGGVVLLGWSFGSIFALAAISATDALPVDVRARLGAYIRSVIVYDPACITFGQPTPTQNWTPLLDTYVPESHRLSVFGQWVSGYFDHGDLSNRDPNTLSWVVPSEDHVPTTFKMSTEQRKHIQRFVDEGFSDLPYMFNFSEQFKTPYRKVAFDPEILKTFPSLKVVALFGEMSGGFAITCMWAMEDDAKEEGHTAFNIKCLPGVNHFWHWEDPESAFKEFIA